MLLSKPRKLLGLGKMCGPGKRWVPSWTSSHPVADHLKTKVRNMGSRCKVAYERMRAERTETTRTNVYSLGSWRAMSNQAPAQSSLGNAKRRGSISHDVSDLAMLDSSSRVSSEQDPFGDSQCFFSKVSLELSLDSINASSSFPFPIVPRKPADLEDKLRKFAKYAELLKDAKSISPSVPKEIARDSGTLLHLCDAEVMQQLHKSGLLKQMVDTELLRRALEFFRLWVDASDEGKEIMRPEPLL